MTSIGLRTKHYPQLTESRLGTLDVLLTQLSVTLMPVMLWLGKNLCYLIFYLKTITPLLKSQPKDNYMDVQDALLQFKLNSKNKLLEDESIQKTLGTLSKVNLYFLI